MTDNRIHRSTLGKLLSSENITVTEGNFPTAWFDVSNRVLGLPTWDVEKDVYDMLIGHEVGHALYTPSEGLESVKDVPHSYLNVVEDARIERLIQSRFPGLIRTFDDAYDKLHYDMDFFKVASRDLNELNFVDKVNLKAKLGSRINIQFDGYELDLFNRIMSSTSWEDVVDLTREMANYMKGKKDEDGPDGSQKNSDNSSSQDDNGDSNPLDSNPNQDSESNDNSNSDSGEDVDDDGTESESSDSDSDDDGQMGSDSSEDVSSDEDGNMTTVDGGAGEEGSQLPEVETQSSFSKKLEELVSDSIGSRGFVPSLKKINGNVIVGYKELSLRRKQDNSLTMYNESSFDEFMKNTSKSVNLLRKEFDLKKSANSYRRSTVAQTGVLNVNKLHSYKYSEDIFLSVRKMANSKNHGLLIFVDYSGSMSGTLGNVIRQMIVLCEFCRLVKVPYRIFGFTTPGYYRESLKPTVYGELNLSHTSIFELFSSKMNNIEHKEAVRYAYMSVQNYYYQAASIYEQTGGTPLQETAVIANLLAKEFKTENRIEKLTVVFMSDGEGSRLNFKDIASYGKPNLVINLNGKDIKLDPWDSTKVIYENLRKTVGASVIGMFFLSQYHSKRGYLSGYGNIDNKRMKDFGFDYKDNNSGFDRYFVMNTKKSLNTRVDDLKIDEEMSRTKMASEFRKFSESKKTSRMFAGTFSEIFS